MLLFSLWNLFAFKNLNSDCIRQYWLRGVKCPTLYNSPFIITNKSTQQIETLYCFPLNRKSKVSFSARKKLSLNFESKIPFNFNSRIHCVFKVYANASTRPAFLIDRAGICVARQPAPQTTPGTHPPAVSVFQLRTQKLLCSTFQLDKFPILSNLDV